MAARAKKECREVDLEMTQGKEIARVGEYLAKKPYALETEHSAPLGCKEEDEGSLPEVNLVMRYVYGYRSFDTRNNVKWTKGNLVLYHTANIAVMLDPEKNEQKYFLRHDSAIISLAIHPSAAIAATGQVARNSPPIYVWETDTQQTLTCLKGFHTTFVKHVSM